MSVLFKADISRWTRCFRYRATFRRWKRRPWEETCVTRVRTAFRGYAMKSFNVPCLVLSVIRNYFACANTVYEITTFQSENVPSRGPDNFEINSILSQKSFS